MAELVVIERVTHRMGSRASLHLAVEQEDLARGEVALDHALAWLTEAEATLTRFDPASELCALNHAAGAPHHASPMLWEAVRAACQAAAATGGRFDPTLLPRLRALGYDRDYEQLAERETPALLDEASATSGDWQAIRFHDATRTITLPAGTQIDLGGIGKGWAADQIIEQHLSAFPNALANIGGDLRACGGPLDGTWAIGVEDPRQLNRNGPTPHIAVITVGAGGVATSGATGHWWLRDGRRQHHIIDPVTGKPARIWITERDNAAPDLSALLASATALAPTAAWAEVAAKVALLRGHEAAIPAVDAAWEHEHLRNADDVPYDDWPVALLVVHGDGTLYASVHLEEYLERHAAGGHLWCI